MYVGCHIWPYHIVVAPFAENVSTGNTKKAQGFIFSTDCSQKSKARSSSEQKTQSYSDRRSLNLIQCTLLSMWPLSLFGKIIITFNSKKETSLSNQIHIVVRYPIILQDIRTPFQSHILSIGHFNVGSYTFVWDNEMDIRIRMLIARTFAAELESFGI